MAWLPGMTARPVRNRQASAAPAEQEGAGVCYDDQPDPAPLRYPQVLVKH
jgi:hypothetical protein